jgi:dGTPase
MEWNKLISAKRFGLEDKVNPNYEHIRSQFQRDYDRLIFSSPFRRLQNKTQVFPLPGRIFVHNRLTHSLEVTSVGRSLGNIASTYIKNDTGASNPKFIDEIGTIVATACLAHDLGNPPFGHSGEEAISSFFRDGKGQHLKQYVSKEQWIDLTNFEGNANALRVLTHTFKGRRQGGFGISYSTLASVVKYPFNSMNSPKGKKYGFFQSERDTYIKIAQELGINALDIEKDIYARHPLVYLVEAADDICYQIMDIEDAHKLSILSTDLTKNLLFSYFDEITDKERLKTIDNTFKIVTDRNEQIAFLRASIIGKLTDECSEAFWKNSESILEGKYKNTLIKDISKKSVNAYQECTKLATTEIYHTKTVVEIQIAGFKILGTLLDEFTQAILSPDRFYSKHILSLIPGQFDINKDDIYSQIQSIVDHVAGMTDPYALDLYRTIKGIHLPDMN